MGLRVEVVKVTPFQQNCSLIWCDQTRTAAVIDPGGDLDKIQRVIESHDLNVQQILLTHGHLDHAGGASSLSELLNVPIIGPHKADQFWLDSIVEQSSKFGFPGGKNCVPDRWLSDSETIKVGHEELLVLFCPGHTPGHVVFYHEQSRLTFVGDVLFKGSIGRTDFPRGDHATLIRSITEQLWPLGNETRFVPGHGPISDFGSERSNNQFVSDARLARLPAKEN